MVDRQKVFEKFIKLSKLDFNSEEEFLTEAKNSSELSDYLLLFYLLIRASNLLSVLEINPKDVEAAKELSEVQNSLKNLNTVQNVY